MDGGIRTWNYWDSQHRNQMETKPIDQVETGGAGEKLELPELVDDHSPLTLGDWFALVAQMQAPSQKPAEWWRKPSASTRCG